MEVDDKPSIGMPPPVPIVPCCVCYPGSEVYPGRGSVRGEGVFVLRPA